MVLGGGRRSGEANGDLVRALRHRTVLFLLVVAALWGGWETLLPGERARTPGRGGADELGG